MKKESGPVLNYTLSSASSTTTKTNFPSKVFTFQPQHTCSKNLAAIMNITLVLTATKWHAVTERFKWSNMDMILSKKYRWNVYINMYDGKALFC